jgi:hypothetical protein
VTVHDAQVTEILEDVRTRLRARRAASAGEAADADDLALSEMQAAIQDVNVNSKVNSHLPLLWEDMVIGRLRAFVQRVVRRLLRWYINPIVDQQNVFNAASAKALTLLAAENARLRREQAALAARLTELGKKPQDD